MTCDVCGRAHDDADEVACVSCRSRHILARSGRLEGETQEDAFRRIAREKPNPREGEGCRICGQDHRCPAAYWPAEELTAHNAAAAARGKGTPADVYGREVDGIQPRSSGARVAGLEDHERPWDYGIKYGA